MSELVKSNPILAQYVPKPTQGFQTFGYEQGAQNVQVQQQATSAFEKEVEEAKVSAESLRVALEELAKKKEEYAAKVTERQQKEAEKARLQTEVAGLRGQVAQAKTDLSSAQAEVASAQRALQAAQAEKARREAEAAKAVAPQQQSYTPPPAQPSYTPPPPVMAGSIPQQTITDTKAAAQQKAIYANVFANPTAGINPTPITVPQGAGVPQINIPAPATVKPETMSLITQNVKNFLSKWSK